MIHLPSILTLTDWHHLAIHPIFMIHLPSTLILTSTQSNTIWRYILYLWFTYHQPLYSTSTQTNTIWWYILYLWFTYHQPLYSPVHSPTPSDNTAYIYDSLTINPYTHQHTDQHHLTIHPIFLIHLPSTLTLTSTQTNIIWRYTLYLWFTYHQPLHSPAHSPTPSDNTSYIYDSLTINPYTHQHTDQHHLMIHPIFMIHLPSTLTLTSTQSNTIWRYILYLWFTYHQPLYSPAHRPTPSGNTHYIYDSPTINPYTHQHTDQHHLTIHPNTPYIYDSPTINPYTHQHTVQHDLTIHPMFMIHLPSTLTQTSTQTNTIDDTPYIYDSPTINPYTHQHTDQHYLVIHPIFMIHLPSTLTHTSTQSSTIWRYTLYLWFTYHQPLQLPAHSPTSSDNTPYIYDSPTINPHTCQHKVQHHLTIHPIFMIHPTINPYTRQHTVQHHLTIDTRRLLIKLSGIDINGFIHDGIGQHCLLVVSQEQLIINWGLCKLDYYSDTLDKWWIQDTAAHIMDCYIHFK